MNKAFTKLIISRSFNTLHSVNKFSFLKNHIKVDSRYVKMMENKVLNSGILPLNKSIDGISTDIPDWEGYRLLRLKYLPQRAILHKKIKTVKAFKN